MSDSNCCFLKCIQVSQEAGKVVWYCHLFQNFPMPALQQLLPAYGQAMQVNLWGLKGKREEHLLGRLHLTREMDRQVVHRTSTTPSPIPLSILGLHCLPLGGTKF